MGSNQKQQRMFAIVQEWESGEESLKAVAARHEVPVERMMYWKRKYRKRAHAQPPGFIQLPAPLPTGITLRFPNGVVLSLPGNATASLLHTLIRLYP
jgi:hypothetical protein